MPLELEHLKISVEALADLATVSENSERMEQLTAVERDGIRAGVIQHFEVAYELSRKLIVRWLEVNLASSLIDQLPVREVYRFAVESGLIADAELWFSHHRARNTTSHAYGRERAERVYRAALGFVNDARLLLEALEANND